MVAGGPRGANGPLLPGGEDGPVPRGGNGGPVAADGEAETDEPPQPDPVR